MPNFIEIGKTTLEKRFTFQYFGSRGTPWAEGTGLGGGVHQPPLATCKISSRADDPSPRYLLPNFLNFVAGVTHKTTKKHIKTVNDVAVLHAATES